VVDSVVHKWEVPEELEIPADPIRARLDFHHQTVVLTIFEEETVNTRVVSALDVAHALASELAFDTGLLPTNTLWWRNTRSGPVTALYVEPRIRILALERMAMKAPERFTVPLPGFIFLCMPGKTPWVYAVKKGPPFKENDDVYKAPLSNIHENGKACPGNHRYPTDVSAIPESFFISFFTATDDLKNRSKKFPYNIILLWEYLNKKKRFPKNDLVRHGTIRDLIDMRIS
jgi:hypothetical protein